MREYLETIAAAGIAAGLAGMLFEGKENESIARYVKLVCSLCLVCVIALPAIRFLSHPAFPELETLSETEAMDCRAIRNTYDRYVIEQARLSMEETVKNRIFEKTGIMPYGVDIEFSVIETSDKTEVSVKSVTVTTKGDWDGLSAYVYGLTGCRPEIRYSGDG